MAVKEILKSFQKLIYEQKIHLVLEIFEETLAKHEEYENYIASYCIISGNVLAHKCEVNNDVKHVLANDLYQLCILCCKTLSKCWNQENADIISCIYNINKYFLLSDDIGYVTDTVMYVLNFLSKVPHSLSAKEIVALKGLLSILTKSIGKVLRLACTSDIVFVFWNELFSISGYLKFDSMNKLLDMFNKFLVAVIENCHTENLLCLRYVQIVTNFVTIWNQMLPQSEAQFADSALISFLNVIRVFYSHFINVCKSDQTLSILLTDVGRLSVIDRYVHLIMFCTKVMNASKFLLQSIGNIANENIEVLLVDTKDCIKLFKHREIFELQFSSQITFLVHILFSTCLKVGNELYQQRKFRESLSLCHRALSIYCVCPEKLFLHEPKTLKYVEKLVACMCNNYKKLEHHNNALKVIALWTVVCPPLSSIFIQHFVLLKMELTDRELLEMSYYDLLIDQKEILLKGWPTSLPEFQIERLLLEELQIYMYYKIPSEFPLRTVLNRLEKYNLNFSDYLLKNFIAGLFSSSDDGCAEQSLKLCAFIDSTTRILKKKYREKLINIEQMRYVYELGNLYFLQFRIQFQKLRYQLEQEENDIVSLAGDCLEPESETRAPEESTDEKTLISLAPMVFENELQLLTNLEKALFFWGKFVSNITLFKEIVNDVYKETLFLENLIEIAYTYRIHCLTEKEISTWEFIYNVGTALQKNEIIVTALTNLLFQPWTVNVEWKNRAEHLLSAVDDEIRLNYQLSVVKRELLDNLNNPEAVKILATVKPDMSKHVILGAKYLFVVGLWQSFQHDCFLDALVTMHDAYCMIVYAVKQRCWFTLGDCYEVQSLFCDLSLFFGYCFVYTMRPRDVRSYFANCLVVSRQLCISLRYCQMLELLSWADILTFELANCNAKLRILEKILGLKIRSEFADVEANLNSVERKSVPSISADGSLLGNNYELNEFLTHHRECSCTYCTCLEYQRLLMQCLILRAAFCTFSNQKNAAGEIFKGISPLIEKLQISVNSKIYPNIDLIFTSNFVKYKLVLGDYYASINMFEEANECNATAERSVDGIFCWIPLTCDIIDQREAIDAAAYEYENDEKGILEFIELKDNVDETKLDQLVSKFKEFSVKSLPTDTAIVDTTLTSEQPTVVTDSVHCDTVFIAAEHRNRTKSSARPRRLFVTMNDTNSSKRMTKKMVPEKQSPSRITATRSTRRRTVKK